MRLNIYVRKTVLIFIIFIIGVYELPAYQDSTVPDLPLSTKDRQVKNLRYVVNKDLQQNLEKQLKQNKLWASLISKQKMSVGIVDLSDQENIKFARVNGDVMMYAASLPKLAILLAACQAFEDGTLKETPNILNDLKIMISISDNQAATRMIDRLGFKKIESVLKDSRYRLYDPLWGGGLWVGKRYAQSGNRYPDPLMGLSHGATVTQVCRFYYMLAMGKLVSRERSKQMLDIMIDPGLHHKFVNTLDYIARDAKVYRKSGTWKNWHADSALVWGTQWRRYIIVALVEDPSGEKICRDLVLTIENVLKSQPRKQEKKLTVRAKQTEPYIY